MRENQNTMPVNNEQCIRFLNSLQASTSAEQQLLQEHPILGSIGAKLFWILVDSANWSPSPHPDEASGTISGLMAQAAFNLHAAIRLLLSRQTYAIPALGRLIIELCLYANHINQKPGAARLYHARHKDAQGKMDRPGFGPTTRKAFPELGKAPHDGRKKMSSEFSNKNLFASLDKTMNTVSPGLAKKLKYNYEAFIDAGAHPNQQLFTSHLIGNPTNPNNREMQLHTEHPHVVFSAAHALYHAACRCSHLAVQVKIAPADKDRAVIVHRQLLQLEQTELAELERLRKESEASWRASAGGASSHDQPKEAP